MNTASVQPVNQPNIDAKKENPHEIVNGIHVEGNVAGNIVNGNNNIIYSPNSTYGDVIKNYYESIEPHQRAMKPQAPYKPRIFVGREPELERLEEHIKSGEAVLVYGQDGLGKTTLTKFVANGAAAKSMNDGVLLVEGIDEEDGSFLGFRDIVQQFFNALFESVPTLQVDTPTARTYLSNTAPLVILDHYQIPETSLTKLRDLFPNGSIIATSEIAIYNDAFAPLEVSPLDREDSIALLCSKSGVENNGSHSVELNEICNLLADVPLAIIKTADIIRSKKLPLRAVADQLSTIRQPSTDPIQAAIERSFGLIFLVLNENERDMLVQAAAAPGFSVDREWLDGLTDGKAASKSLEDMELLQANSPRLRMAEGLRRVVLSSTKYVTESRESLLQYILKQLESKSLDFEYVSGELGNILGLLRWTFDEKRWDDVITLGRAVDTYLTLNGLWDARKSVLKLVEEAARNLESSNPQSGQIARAWALHQLGSLEAGLGSREAAHDILKQALDLRKSLNDTEGAAFTQYNMWVLFPPPTFFERVTRTARRIVGKILESGRLMWVILALICLALLLYFGITRWKTYQNDDFGFQFKYPARSEVFGVGPGGLGVENFHLPAGSNDYFDKSLIVTANRNRRENQCDIPIDPEGWEVEVITKGDVQFLKATERIVDIRQTSRVVYAAPKESEPGTWACLIFSYSPREIDNEKLGDVSLDSEIAVFERIFSTFKWLPPGPTTSTEPPPPATGTTPDTGLTPESGTTPGVPATPDYGTTIAPDTSTPTDTPSPTSTASFTPTITVTPSYTATVCNPNTSWPTYTVQSGDTLFQISLWYSDIGYTVPDLQRANCRGSSTIIFSGERLYVPGTPPPGSIFGYLYLKSNPEIRLSRVDVLLENINGDIIAKYTTNEYGEYEFTEIPYGTYFIFESPVTVRPQKTTTQNFGLAPAP
ncbi:MAG TPA: LysM peptidoglycan-binding domain-containing protein [Anaerolineales bacterium]|nr:LysM peptidoglycan-binding domain-containing protein [Anaerolineales bacterium]